MPNGKHYWLHEANRHLELALVGAQQRCREQINKAIECLDKHEKDLKNKK